ncbi:MATE family Na+-driven efflux transporter [Thorsellia anophelis]|uniref:Na+-driven multidrug efflux pump n=1 Tax=Thorsellia anophelis DSM 18579 TaxID=1123402 RepID=A0A1I0F0S0_9GAMM|nr:MATE family Na+-driven efflux transporter [Thorsellia anophelis]SET51545.1 Na+-driven multidrug efflux pump [Thorsellia anophelis DSM 18579]
MQNLKSIDYRLWIVLILTQFIPLIYMSTRIHILGTLPEGNAFTIASQIAWLNIGFEVISEALLIPLAFVLGKAINDKLAFCKMASTALSVIFMVYLMASLIVISSIPELINLMKQNSQLIDETITYMRLEVIAIMVGSVYIFFNLLLVLNNQQAGLYKLLVIQTILTIIGDVLLTSNFSFSFKLGVIGIGINNIWVNLILVCCSFFVMCRVGIKLSFRKIKFREQTWIRDWSKIGLKSGMESFIRNSAFILVILKIMNEIEQSGVFWLANNFIWGWLLLPILTLGQLIKQDSAINQGLSHNRIMNYIKITSLICVCLLLLVPFYEFFISLIIDKKNAKEVSELIYLMLGFFFVFAFNNVIDNYFYGTGRTDLILYQSVIVNLFYYSGVYILYTMELFIPSLETIALIFGIGMVIDSIVTGIMYIQLRKKRELNVF